MPSLQERCEQAQEQLIAMRYLDAEATLFRVEQEALRTRDWDALARLYMPLQEARRQRRQRCGEGIFRLDLLALKPDERLDPERLVEQYPIGQLLVAGLGTIEPAVRLRKLAAERKLYLETFLAAVYPIEGSIAIVIVPLDDSPLPDARPRTLDRLRSELPPDCLILHRGEVPSGPHKGTYETYGKAMSFWERLHAPFLAAADRLPDPIQRIEAYRQTIRVDYACELAHQKLSDVARNLARSAVAMG